MFDLGSILSPQQPDQTQPSAADSAPATAKDGWDAYLADPSTRAALLSFGLQAMAGGWGSPMSQLAVAGGAGLEAGAQTGANIQKKTDSDAAIARTSAREEQEDELKREGMSNQKDIANIYANQRLQSATIRAGSGPSNLKEQNMWLKAKADQLNFLTKNLASMNITAEEADQIASRKADEALAQARAATGGGASAGQSATPQGGGPAAGTVPSGVPGAAAGAAPQSAPIIKVNPKTGQKAQYNPATGQWQILP